MKSFFRLDRRSAAAGWRKPCAICLTVLLTRNLSASAQPVDIPDPALRKAILLELDRPEDHVVTKPDMESLVKLNASRFKTDAISRLTGLETATHLQELDLRGSFSFMDGSTLSHRITDFSPLTGLNDLRRLRLGLNDLTSLALPDGLTGLTTLELGNNDLTTLTLPLGLSSLTLLRIGNNPLTSLIAPEGMDVEALDVEGFSKSAIAYYRPVLRIRRITVAPGQEVRLAISGPQGVFVVEASPDLRQWADATRFTITGWVTEVAVGTLDNPALRFFRLRE